MFFIFRYKDFIPDSVGKRVCLSSSADGNCIFHTFSIAVFGDETRSFLLRLMTIVMSSNKVLEYSKYVSICIDYQLSFTIITVVNDTLNQYINAVRPDLVKTLENNIIFKTCT